MTRPTPADEPLTEEEETNPATWRLVYDDLSADEERWRPTFDARDQTQLAALGFSTLGYVRATHARGSKEGAMTQVWTVGSADAYGVLCYHKAGGIETVSFTTVLGNGTLIMTERKPPFLKWLPMAIAVKAQAGPGCELHFVAHGLDVDKVYALHQTRVRAACAREATRPVAHVALDPYIGVRRSRNQYNAIKRAYEQAILQRAFTVFFAVGGSALIATAIAGLLRHDAWFFLWALLTIVVQLVIVTGLQRFIEAVVAPLLWMRRPKARIAYHLETMGKDLTRRP